MRESRTYGFVRGALSNGRPYRVRCNLLDLLTAAYGTEGELRPSGSYGRNRRDFCRAS
jgi:hypothetical protein